MCNLHISWEGSFVARCDWGPWCFVHSRGKWNPRRSRGCHLPSRVYKIHGPQSQRATHVLLYLCIIVIPLIEVLLTSSKLLRRTIHCLISRRTRYNSLEPAVVSYTVLEIDRRRERSRWCTPVYNTFHVTRPVEPCKRAFCCASHDWFSTNQTSQFVTEV